MLRALSELLWRERDLLEVLLYQLEVGQLLLTAGKTQRLPIASREVEEVLSQIRAAELGRAAEVHAVASVLGLSSDASLLRIAEASPAPWDEILLEHRTAFVALANEIATVAEADRDILAAAHHARQETLTSLGESVEFDDEAPEPVRTKLEAGENVGAHLDDAGAHLDDVGAYPDDVAAYPDDVGAYPDAAHAETIVELHLQEVSYQAALTATSRVLQPSLLDFLR